MARAALLALLVACAFVGTAAGGSPPTQTAPPPQIDDGNGADVAMLGLDGTTRSEVLTQGVDVSTAVATQRETASSAIDRRAMQLAFDRAEDDQARRELLFEAATDVEIAISALRSQQRGIRSDFVNGTIGSHEYARSRAVANARADELRSDLTVIRELAGRVPQFSMRSRLGTLEATLITFSGPVSDHVQSTIDGRTDGTRVYVAVSPNGSSLSVIEDGQYLRETARSDLWTPDTAVLIGFDEVISRVAEVYPAFNTSRASGGISTLGPEGTDLAPAGLYRINIQYQDRTTAAYLDGDTRNVFYEVQRVRLASMQPGPAVSEVENGTRLAVNRTFDGGPLRIAVADNATGTPADVPVLVDDDRYQPGSDGVVWALAPEGRAEVVALGPTGNVSVTVVPVRPNYVNVSTVEPAARMRTPTDGAAEP